MLVSESENWKTTKILPSFCRELKKTASRVQLWCIPRSDFLVCRFFGYDQRKGLMYRSGLRFDLKKLDFQQTVFYN